MKKLPMLTFVFLLALCIAHAAYYYPLLPERIASHFGGSGLPDAWSSKASFVRAYLVVAASITVLFPGIGFLLPKVPDKLINLQNKDYWLSPERRKETFDFLSRRFLWLGSTTLLLLVDGFHQVYRVNIGKAAVLEHPMTSIVAYLVFTILWTIGLIVKFWRKP